MKIGEIIPLDREITLNEGKPTVTVKVANTGDRPIQVGSHFHFFEVNRTLNSTEKKHMVFIWTSLPELLSALNQVKKKKSSLPRSAEQRESSV